MAKQSPNFEFHHEAILEALDATNWYTERSSDVAGQFKAELRAAENSVKWHPSVWMPYLHGTRCFKFDRFPYALVYVERGERIVGIAVAHLKRRPGYWRKRLKD